MRVVFMGTPVFSVPVLESLVSAGHEVVAVYCQPPRRAGRGKKERPSPVQARAEALGLTVRHPLNFKDESDLAAFEALGADVAVVVAYGLILPQRVLDAPRLGCLNIHASLLPRWRGAAPIHRAIMAGDAKTGICVMQMEAGLDTGPVLLRAETQITARDTTERLHDRLSAQGAALIVQALDQIETLTPVQQSGDGVTYAHKIDKSEAHINWAEDAVVVDRKIRGLSPFPGAWCNINGERVKLLDSAVVPGSGAPGEVLGAPLVVACGTGAVEILRIQRAGKSAMDADAMSRGFNVPLGRTLA